MMLSNILAGTMLFGSLAFRTPNVQPNPDDYEVSIGFTNDNYYANLRSINFEDTQFLPAPDDYVIYKIPFRYIPFRYIPFCRNSAILDYLIISFKLIEKCLSY